MGDNLNKSYLLLNKSRNIGEIKNDKSRNRGEMKNDKSRNRGKMKIDQSKNKAYIEIENLDILYVPKPEQIDIEIIEDTS